MSSPKKVLRKLPRDKAFYFFTSIGNYTGEHASSLREFVDKLNSVNIKSLEFHLHRGDFEKWIAETLEDKELAEEVKDIKQQEYVGEILRNHLQLVIYKRYESLG